MRMQWTLEAIIFKTIMKTDSCQSGSASEDRFIVRYRITDVDAASIEQVARDIAIEQTIEAPLDCATESILQNGIIGRVESIAPFDSDKMFDVRISFLCATAGYSTAQLINVIYGNISLKNNITVTGLEFPRCLLSMFPGPSHGIDGTRAMLKAYRRPLACTPLKPMGLSVGELSALAAAMARGGVDLIKDDHGLGNQPFHPFRERVLRCQEAIQTENARSGRSTIYCPMLSGGFDEIEAQARFCMEAGVRGMLIAPMLVGFDTMRYLAQTYGAVIIAHPALTGTFFCNSKHGITVAVLLGTLFRLLGGDISVFPNAGGRFPFSKKQCGDISAALRRPLGSVKSAFPCPAGGMSLDTMEETFGDYGSDTTILIGGNLLKRSRDLDASVAAFMERIRTAFPACTG